PRHGAPAAGDAHRARTRGRDRHARPPPLAPRRLARRARAAGAVGRARGGGDVTARPASVWIVNQYALPRGATGITRHGDLASVLRRHGHDVTVIASGFDNFTRGGKAGSGVTDHDGVRFVWLETTAYRKNDARRVLNMVEFYARAVTARLGGLATRPDVVIGSSPHLLSGLAGLTLARRHLARFVLELRDVWPDDLV